MHSLLVTTGYTGRTVPFSSSSDASPLVIPRINTRTGRIHTVPVPEILSVSKYTIPIDPNNNNVSHGRRRHRQQQQQQQQSSISPSSTLTNTTTTTTKYGRRKELHDQRVQQYHVEENAKLTIRLDSVRRRNGTVGERERERALRIDEYKL